MTNKDSFYSETEKDNSKETNTPDIKTYLYKGDLFTGESLDVRDFHKLMPEKRSLNFKNPANTDRSFNKIMEDTPGN